ncbi:PREDICTED: uncharacterized protein LOC106807855 [Priapulus caudatus]|uniref:Uncharacterized protein LOC106807855 n=1 Tax=Priapulus caudatus TaxID=37621 RepID=A0ABM1E0V9_PRICU|nr:PREDICTED: uncharacterized protein LOC106807855 [Priapulus caudatus]
MDSYFWDDRWRTRRCSMRLKSQEEHKTTTGECRQASNSLRMPLSRVNPNLSLNRLRESTRKKLKTVKKGLTRTQSFLNCASGRSKLLPLGENYSPLLSPCGSPGHTPQRRASGGNRATRVYEPFFIDSPSKTPVLNATLAADARSRPAGRHGNTPVRRQTSRTPRRKQDIHTPGRRSSKRLSNRFAHGEAVLDIEEGMAGLHQLAANLTLITPPRNASHMLPAPIQNASVNIAMPVSDEDAYKRRSTIVLGKEERLV